jgi:hypothetical protein
MVIDTESVLPAGPGQARSIFSTRLAGEGIHSIAFTRITHPNASGGSIIPIDNVRFAEVTPVPLPGAILLFSAGLLSIAVLVIDDLGFTPTTDAERKDLLEVVEERHGHASTIVTSQLPVENWHEQIGDPTIADAILDRLIHNAHKICLKGGSMRKNMPA